MPEISFCSGLSEGDHLQVVFEDCPQHIEVSGVGEGIIRKPDVLVTNITNDFEMNRMESINY